jgi:hypothetical protein
VIDGDTIVVQHLGKPEQVRLIGVDTPEMTDQRPSVRYLAEEAKWLTERIALNQKLRMDLQQTPSERDRYGRLLAFAYRQTDGYPINLSINKEGFGFAYLKYPFDDTLMQQYTNAEQQARKNRKGLWEPVYQKYSDLFLPKDEPRANSWIKTGDALRKMTPEKSEEWYRSVLSEYPNSTAAPIARQRLGRPPSDPIDPPVLDEKRALEMLGEVRVVPEIEHPSLPDPPQPTWATSTAADTPSDLTERPVATGDDSEPSTQSEVGASAYAPSRSPGSRSSRSTPGTEVHVRGYTRKNGTYVAPYTRRAPRGR